jgi:hypothetical protein
MGVHGKGQVPVALPSGKQPLQFYLRLCGPLGPILTGVKKIKFLSCIGFRTQGYQAIENRYIEHMIPPPP